MQISFSITGIFDLDNPKRYLDYVSDAGFNNLMLDFSVFYSKDLLESYGTKKTDNDIEEARRLFRRFMHQFQNNAAAFGIMRAPHLKWDSKRTDLNNMLFRTGKECLEICRKNGCRNIIFQPLFSGIAKEDQWQENYRYYLELGKLAKESGIGVLLENQCSDIGGHLVRGVCADASAASEWIDLLNQELDDDIFGFCLDTGASSLCGQNMQDVVIAFGKRLKAVLIRECGGMHEESRLPFTAAGRKGGNTDWLSLIRGLRNIEFDGLLIIDARDTLRGFSHLLRPQLYPVVKSVADFFKWQIEIEKRLKKYSARVLFGAGNMCRNYMDCYGEQYPPLFICDNNKKLWEKQFCGFTVKPPAALKELPEECAVIICNMFYKESAEQIKSMGIKHIETFNDEYLPMLHLNESLGGKLK